jgi:SpoVK/Ycf46/Vps4 family AAA+-type ATPase
VIDIFFEEDEKPDRDNTVYLNPYFWANVGQGCTYDPETDEDKTPLDEDTVLEREEIDVPIHPWLIIFHLQKHRRLKVHVAQLEEYDYDEALAEKLILPADQKSLVKLLIDTKGGMFEDIVRGKGGGAVVLLSGLPGTGKTLTAEVYAESEKRALYSVQCSQLGVRPEDLEEALLKVFERAKRWNAVMLLDEADVYVHERGNNMMQNAIVGVFLRVLEYQATILFLTTNRPNDVDDAIASRCIARIVYVPPGAQDAARIWQVLASNAGIKIAAAVIKDVVEKNPTMTGRDIKNILKLAALMDGADQGITSKMVAYVQQFKPTGEV